VVAARRDCPLLQALTMSTVALSRINRIARSVTTALGQHGRDPPPSVPDWNGGEIASPRGFQTLNGPDYLVTKISPWGLFMPT
jgi:hypothetical protein